MLQTQNAATIKIKQKIKVLRKIEIGMLVIADENINWSSCCEKQYGNSSKH